MNAHYDIYTLSDATGVRYVGQTRSGWATRLRNYRSGSTRRVKNGHPGRYYSHSAPDLRRVWMDGLTAAGRLDDLHMEVIDQAVGAAQADMVEKRYIERYLTQGCSLVNINHNPRGRVLDSALKAEWRATGRVPGSG